MPRTIAKACLVNPFTINKKFNFERKSRDLCTYMITA